MRNADALLASSPAIRYVAVHVDDELRTVQRPDLAQASSSESDRYEEILVNPTLLAMLVQHGNIHCGGMRAVLVRYGHFTQLVAPAPGGHVSIAIEPAGTLAIAGELLDRLRG